MIVLIALSVICILGYLGLLGYYLYHWKPVFPQVYPARDLPYCSIIIPARNEGAQISHCLQSVTTQAYPADRYEVIVIDDGSEDDTVKCINKFAWVKLLHTREGQRGKKHALTSGIAFASGDIILTTDADCRVSSQWLRALVDTFDANTHLATGPVVLHRPQSAFHRFQALDLTGLAMITAAGIQSGLHHLANGANMAFRKSTFEAVGGFKENIAYASGDDVFLAQSIAKAFPGGIRYAWDQRSHVLTQPCYTLKEFVRQRLRWATKNRSLREKSVFWIWAFVWFVYSISLLTLSISFLHNYLFTMVSVVPIALIGIMEYVFLRKGVSVSGQEGLMKGFAISFLSHYLYVICIGIASLATRKYLWKGRKVY